MRQTIFWLLAKLALMGRWPFVLQIHRAVLSNRGAARTKHAAGTTVAVKVRHPGVSATMQRDFALMQRAASLSASTPGLARLNLQVLLALPPAIKNATTTHALLIQ